MTNGLRQAARYLLLPLISSQESLQVSPSSDISLARANDELRQRLMESTGAAGLVVGQPFDVIKVRYQTPQYIGRYASTWRALGEGLSS